MRGIEAAAIAKQLESQQLALQREQRDQKRAEKEERLRKNKAELLDGRSRREKIKALKAQVLRGTISSDEASESVRSLTDWH